MQTPVPSDLKAKLAQAYPEHASRIVEALETPPSVSLRLNSARTWAHRPYAELRDGDIPWLPTELDGYWLSERPVFALDPLWHAGAYYVQDASAMTLATSTRPLRSTWRQEHASSRPAPRYHTPCK